MPGFIMPKLPQKNGDKIIPACMFVMRNHGFIAGNMLRRLPGR